jgi:DNA modification methylase
MKILQGDAPEVLKTLPDQSVHCIVTSPPYWGLRDYGTGTWEGGDEGCNHYRDNKGDNRPAGRQEVRGGAGDAIYRDTCRKCGAVRVDKQIGLEETIEEYVEKLVEVFREARRVLRDDGTIWLNLGDSYAGSGGAHAEHHKNPGISKSHDRRGVPHHGARREPGRYLAPEGLKPKDLCMIPARVAMALQADGWWVRSEIIWNKTNPMPESVTDRPTTAHEKIFLFSKSGNTKHWYHRDKPYSNEVKEKPSPDYRWKKEKTREEVDKEPDNLGGWSRINLWRGHDYYYNAEAIMEKSVTDPKSASSMTFGSLEGKNNTPEKARADRVGKKWEYSEKRNKRNVWTVATKPYSGAHFATFPEDLIKDCILAGSPLGGVVLDPFFGSGTTGVVAMKTGRDFIGIELNPEYIKLAKKRLSPVMNQRLQVLEAERRLGGGSEQ